MKGTFRYGIWIGLLLILVSVTSGACAPSGRLTEEDRLGTSVAQTLTVIALQPVDTATPEPGAPPVDFPVVAWYGRVIGLPEEFEFGDFLKLFPEGVGEVGLAGETPEVETAIEALRDKEEPSNMAHYWGRLTCGVVDHGGCRLHVDRMRVDGPGPFFDPDPVEGWEGVIYSGPPGPRSGGDDYFALVGNFHIQYGVWGIQEEINAQIEGLRDTESVVHIWGELMAGIPDWNGTQIRVSRIEMIDAPSGPVPPPPNWSEVETGWQIYVNEIYGYQFQYPEGAKLTEMGITGFPSEELPEGMSTEDYFAQLEEEYGNSLCVQVEVALGYLTISAPPNEGFRYAICGRTGVGVGELENKVEMVMVDGRTYEAKGFEWKSEGETLNNHNETFVIQLENGFRLEYGARPVSDATYEDYLMKGKETLLQIINSFEVLE